MYQIFPVDTTDFFVQVSALAWMKQVPRWQKQDGSLSDPEQYLWRAIDRKSNVKIVFIRNPIHGFAGGAAFIGTVEDYDRPKTKAMVEYGGGDGSVLDEPAIWLNYESWKDIPPTPTAFKQEELPAVWEIFRSACKEAFPSIRQVIVRSRLHNIWSYVYTSPPWQLLAEVDLTGKKYGRPGFSWTNPDGRPFGNYDDRFSRYGILVLPLK